MSIFEMCIRDRAKAMISAFDTTAKVDAAFAELKAYWDRLLDIFYSCF